MTSLLASSSASLALIAVLAVVATRPFGAVGRATAYHSSFATSTPNVILASAAATTSTAATATATSAAAATQQPKTYREIYLQTICENQPSCHMVGNVSESDRTLAVRNCMCDAECNVYGDCCFDSPSYNEDDQKSNFKRFHCPKESWYLKASCSAGYEDSEIIRRCADGVKGTSNDVRVLTPVTDVERNVTYANLYCAACAGRDPRQPGLRAWNVTFRCEVNATVAGRTPEARSPTDGETETETSAAADELEAHSVARNLSWDEGLGEFRAYYGGRAYKCEPQRQPPAELVGGGALRRCTPVVAGCPVTTADRRLAANCAAFTLLVHDETLAYRNSFCAQCHNVTTPLNGCRFQLEDRFSTPQRIFSGANKANGNAPCSDPNANPDLKKRFCPS